MKKIAKHRKINGTPFSGGRHAIRQDTGDPITVIVQPVRPNVRQGRNEPCRCGSGKKFKRCCGARVQAKKTPTPIVGRGGKVTVN